MLTVNQQDISLGNLKFGQSIDFKYTLKNESSESMIINKLITGCSSCTKAYTNKTYLKPGDSSDINVNFKPGIKGKQTKTVDVIYNNINTLRLKFTAEVD